jgi:uncharacterized membrane protein
MNKIFLDKARLKTPTDSVLLVGIVLLVYSLASLAGSDPDKFESKLFSNTLVAYINAFTIVFMYWSLFSVVLNSIPNLDDTLFLLFLVLLIRMMKKLYEHQIQMHSADIISYDSETKTF